MSPQREAPDYITDGDKVALMELRHAIWHNGLKGFAGGFVFGSLSCYAIPRIPILANQFKILPKHHTAVPLLSGAFFMLVGSTLAGRNNAHTLHHILAKAPKKEQLITEYQMRRKESLDKEQMNNVDTIEPPKPKICNKRRYTRYGDPIHELDESANTNTEIEFFSFDDAAKKK